MRCVLLAGGWYLNPTVNLHGVFYIADSLAARDEFDTDFVVYGPAAWSGRTGPASGLLLMRLRPAHWDKWFAAAEAHAYGDGPEPSESLRVWPAVATLTEHGRERGLDQLDGVSFESQQELIARVSQHAAARSESAARFYTAEGRLKISNDFVAARTGRGI